MKVLVTGAAGFINGYLISDLLASGYEVVGIDNFSKYGYLQHDFYDHPRFRLVWNDVRQMYPLDFKGYDIVLCFAALIGGIKYFHKIPYRIARDNTDRERPQPVQLRASG